MINNKCVEINLFKQSLQSVYTYNHKNNFTDQTYVNNSVFTVHHFYWISTHVLKPLKLKNILVAYLQLFTTVFFYHTPLHVSTKLTVCCYVLLLKIIIWYKSTLAKVAFSIITLRTLQWSNDISCKIKMSFLELLWMVNTCIRF